MTSSPGTVFIVDDDPAVRTSLQTLLAMQGLPSVTYASAREFLAVFDPEAPGCVVLDMLLDGEDGLDLLRDLSSRPVRPPVIMLTAHGSVPTSVQALRCGAIDYLEKPAPPSQLVARIREALEVDRRERDVRDRRTTIEGRAQRLSGRERKVAELLIAGNRSRQIAVVLGISVRTVEGYRAKLLEKMQASTTAQLVTMLLESQLVPRR